MARPVAGTLYQRGKTWWLKYQLNGERIQTSLRTTNKRDAERERDRILEPLGAKDEVRRLRAVASALASAEEQEQQVQQAAKPKMTVAEAWLVYLDSSERPQSGRVTLADYASHWSKFVTWWGTHAADRPALEQVTREDANEFARWLKEDGLSPRRFNLIIGTCKRLFKVLGPQLNALDNPFERIALRSLELPARRDFTEAQVLTMLQKAEGELRILLALGSEAGMRLADAATLDWLSVDLRQGQLVFAPAKTRRRGKIILLPILPSLRALLEAIPEPLRHGPVLPKTCAAYLRNRPQVSQHLSRFFRSCGFETTESDVSPGRPLSGKRRRSVLGFHSLRHYWVSQCFRFGVPQSVVMAMVGHGSPAVTRGYTHVGMDQARAELSKVPSMLQRSGDGFIALPAAPSTAEQLITEARKRLAAGGKPAQVLADLKRILAGEPPPAAAVKRPRPGSLLPRGLKL